MTDVCGNQVVAPGKVLSAQRNPAEATTKRRRCPTPFRPTTTAHKRPTAPAQSNGQQNQLPVPPAISEPTRITRPTSHPSARSTGYAPFLAAERPAPGTTPSRHARSVRGQPAAACRFQTRPPTPFPRTPIDSLTLTPIGSAALEQTSLVKEPKLHQNGNGAQPPSAQPPPPINAQRPPLNRTDSRTNFPFRLPFPNQQGAPVRPLIRQPGPPGTPPFSPRNAPPPGPRPQGTPGQFAASQQPRAGFRPPTPFPRPPLANQRPPGVFPPRPASTFGGPRPLVEEPGIRSSALDTANVLERSDDNRNTSDYVKAPSIAAMNNRSYSLSSNAPEQVADQREEARRRSISSVDSMGENRPGSRPVSRQGSITGSTESLDKKPENELPSRPESRSASRMNKIEEDEDKSNSLTEVSPKSIDLSNLSQNESVSKSQPTFSKTPDSSSIADSKPTTLEKRENGSVEGPSQSGRYLDLGKPPKAKSPARSEGDNDSGVDESTQGNDQSSNSENRSPRKSSKSRTSSSTPVARSLSRGSKSPSLKSPDSNATTPGSVTDRKKVPMNKVQVGSAPSPNLKVVRSKIGSLENASYKPGGGHVKIESRKLDFKGAGPRIEAKNDKYVPKGSDKKIVQQKLQWSAKSKIGSLENATHKPKGGDKKIESKKLDFKEKAQSKVGSKANMNYVPGGGDVKTEDILEDKDTDTEKENASSVSKVIETKKIELKVTSKIGSLDNVKHKPGGGDKKIFDDKEYLKQSSMVSSLDHSLSGSQNSLPSQPEKVPNEDENLNQKH